MPSIDVRTTEVPEKDALIDTLMVAFSADPLARRIWSKTEVFVAAFPRFAEAFGVNAFPADDR